jgi:hypothetical protein
MAQQTVASSDGATVTIGAALGYSIGNIRMLYDRLHHAEDTVAQLAAEAIAQHVAITPRSELSLETVAECAADRIRAEFESYGLSDVEVRITDFAIVRAIRLIQDQRWTSREHDGLSTGRAVATNGSNE